MFGWKVDVGLTALFNWHSEEDTIKSFYFSPGNTYGLPCSIFINNNEDLDRRKFWLLGEKNASCEIYYGGRKLALNLETL